MREWWRGGVVYQIYPRSFRDGNGDGIGDLPGVLEGLDYVASLGADAIWISPFFKSPMKDFGYDVEDYLQVDPIFGDNVDFSYLLARAHALGLKVIIDLVINHTSSTHPWFLKSRRDRLNDQADWYVWADPKPDGSPPNNWLSIFGGPAWQWEPRRGQYYFHQFLAEQPDLNVRNPVVQEALLGIVRHWLDRGVDGIRLDACNHYMHDPLLRDNPARPAREAGGLVADANPYGMQRHLFDRSQPENLKFIARIRALVDSYDDRMVVAEVSCDDQVKRVAEYVGGSDRLHTAYSFALLGSEINAVTVRDVIETFEAQPGGGWPSWAFSNHDVARVRTRWGGDQAPDAFSKMTTALLGSLRGTVFLYQGEELGLTEAEVPYERMLDPYGITFYPEFKGRDGCRTPMPWHHEEEHAGFSPIEPHLPIPNEHHRLAVSVQEKRPDSVLRFVRRFLAWRKTQPAVLTGSIQFRDAPEPLLVFERKAAGQRLLFVFNLGGGTERLPLADETVHPVESVVGAVALPGRLDEGAVLLPPFGFWVAELKADASSAKNAA